MGMMYPPQMVGQPQLHPYPQRDATMKQATASYCGARPHERDTPPPAKRQKIWWDSDEEEEEEEERGFDPDTYYDKARNDNTTPEVAAFAKKVFRKCLSQEKRKELSKLYPRPSIEATQVPKADQLIVDFMAKDFPKKQDERLSRIQASVVAACAPITNLLSSMEEQNLSGSQEELIPADEVLRVLQASLVLIGNSVNYISQQRREAILSAFPTSRSNLAKILRQICNKDFEVGEKETELFGSKAMEKVSERVNALEAFKKAVAKADTSQKKGSRLLGKGPAAKYGSSAGQSSWHPYSREEA